MVFDARYEKVRHEGQLRDCAVIIALGITPEGQRVILGVSAALSEVEVHWRTFFHTLVQRGMCGVTFIVSDDHSGLAVARRGRPGHRRRIRMPQPPGCRTRLKESVADYAKTAPKLATWMGESLPQGFTVFAPPAAHQQRMRTSNALERVRQELKGRTRVAPVFPNEKSLLRSISALLAEPRDEWKTGKIYLSMEPVTQPAT